MKFSANGDGPGAVVTDLPGDFRDLSPDERTALCDGFDTFGLLVFRGREMPVEEQMALCAELGTLIDQAAQGQGWFNITNLGGGYAGKLCFHADFSNSRGLLTGASLYASALPSGPTATIFADTGAAYAELPEILRARISRRLSVHAAVRPGTIVDEPLRHQSNRAADPRTVHPLVLEHPSTGKPVLFVNDMQTERIVDMEREESTRMLDELASWIQQPRFVYRHVWQLHDLVVWDQIVMQHSRAAERTEGERTLRRVSFTHPSYAAECQRSFDALGGRAGRSGEQAAVM